MIKLMTVRKERREVYRVLVGKAVGDNLEDKDVDARLILDRTLQSELEGCGLDSSCCVQGQAAGFCGHGNEPSDAIKCREVVD
jgi:hypothetical protein